VKLCDKCKHATWKTTANGRRHPDKSGICQKVAAYTVPPLPACAYWIGGPPKPNGRHIERGRELQDHCPYWETA
jgi:hypothetical protein